MDTPIRGKCSRRELMWLLDEHILQENEKLYLTSASNTSQLHPEEPLLVFDFLYLPIDFKRKGNLGYAFVNFTTWQGAVSLYNCWRGSNWTNCSYNTKKICRIDPAKFQVFSVEPSCSDSSSDI